MKSNKNLHNIDRNRKLNKSKNNDSQTSINLNSTKIAQSTPTNKGN